MAQNLIFGVNVVGRTTFQVITFHVPSVAVPIAARGRMQDALTKAWEKNARAERDARIAEEQEKDTRLPFLVAIWSHLKPFGAIWSSMLGPIWKVFGRIWVGFGCVF